MIKKSDVANPIMPGETEQSVDKPTAIEHASMPITPMNATIRALVLTLPSLILFQIPPQKLEQQPGSAAIVEFRAQGKPDPTALAQMLSKNTEVHTLHNHVAAGGLLRAPATAMIDRQAWSAACVDIQFGPNEGPAA